MDKIRYHMFPDTVKVANKVHVKTCYVVCKLKISISLSPIQICCFTSTEFFFYGNQVCHIPTGISCRNILTNCNR